MISDIRRSLTYEGKQVNSHLFTVNPLPQNQTKKSAARLEGMKPGRGTIHLFNRQLPRQNGQNCQNPFGPLREVIPTEQRTIRPADSHDLHRFVNVQRKKEF